MAGLTPEADGSYLVEDQRVTMPVEVRSAHQAAATFLVQFNTFQCIKLH